MENEIMNNVEVIEEVGEGIATDVNSGSGMGPVVKGVVGASIAIAAYNIEELTTLEKAKACWKCYIPAVVTGTLSAACIIGGHSVNARRNTALAAAYALSDSALREYKEKVVETIGEKKEQTIREKVAEERIKKDPATNREIIVTDKGTTRCYDYLSGRYFYSDVDTINKAIIELNRMIVTDMCGYASLNDFYDELGLDHTGIGDDLGWRIDDGRIDISFSAKVSSDGVPCLVLDYSVAPKHGFARI